MFPKMIQVNPLSTQRSVIADLYSATKNSIVCGAAYETARNLLVTSVADSTMHAYIYTLLRICQIIPRGERKGGGHIW